MINNFLRENKQLGIEINAMKLGHFCELVN